MERMKLLHAIVEHEQQARKAYAEAASERDGLEENLRAEFAALREEAFAAADAELAALAESERAHAEEQILQQEEKQKQSLSAASRWFQENHDAAVQRVFSLVVESDV